MSALVSDIQAPAVPLIKTRSGRYRLNQKDMSSWLILTVGRSAVDPVIAYQYDYSWIYYDCSGCFNRPAFWIDSCAQFILALAF